MDDESGPSSLSKIIEAIEVVDATSIEAIEIVDTVSMVPMVDNKQYNVCVKILEQPIDSVRFRYKSEEKSTSIIFGINSTSKKKTFPSIQIEGYEGRAVVIVSCVTKDPPYRPHPHSLVGKKCKQGICTIEVPASNIPKIVTFLNLGIQCVKIKDIEETLKERQALQIDPFRTGFEHRRHPNNIDRKAVRLCFQVFLEGSQKGKFVSLLPLKSNIIYDIRSRPPLVLRELSHSSATVAGGLKMMLFCEKVDEKDVQVRFFEEDKRGVVWEEIIDSESIHVHKQVGIRFKTPKYRLQEVGIYSVRVQLLRPSDQTTSNSLPFWMVLDIDQSSNGAKVDTSSADTSVENSLQPTRSHKSPETVGFQVFPEQTLFSMQNNYTLSPIQEQLNISPMMRSNVPALNEQLFQYVDHQPESNLLNKVSENQAEMQPVIDIEEILNDLHNTNNVMPENQAMMSISNIDQSSNGAEVDPFSAGTSAENFLHPADYTLSPRLEQQYQPNIPAMMPLSNISASTNVQSFGYISDHQPEANNGVMESISNIGKLLVQHDQSSKGAEVYPFSAGTNAANFLHSVNNILSPRQEQQYQPNIPAMMPLSNISHVQMDYEWESNFDLINFPESRKDMLLESTILEYSEKKPKRKEICFGNFTSKLVFDSLPSTSLQMRHFASPKCAHSSTPLIRRGGTEKEGENLRYRKYSAEENLTEIPLANLSINFSRLSISDSIQRKAKSSECLVSADLAEKKEDLKYRKSLTEENFTENLSIILSLVYLLLIFFF